MGELPRYAWQAGRVVPFAAAGVSLADRGLLFGESLYEVVPITGGRVRFLEAHVDRMGTGATALQLVGVPEPATWQRIVAELLAAESIDQGVLYAQLTGGEAPRNHVASAAPTFFAYLISLSFPPPSAGIKVVTTDDPRWARCDLKTTMLLPSVLGKRSAERQGADEVLFFGPDGALREGGSTNAFIVERGTLVAVPRGEHVLPGITQDILVELAVGAGIEVVFEPVDRARLMEADEVFVASTTRLAMPVVAVDTGQVGDGAPGPVTRALDAALRDAMEL